MIKFITPIREKRKQIAADPEKVKDIFRQGGEKAKAIADNKMKTVREKIGLTL